MNESQIASARKAKTWVALASTSYYYRISEAIRRVLNSAITYFTLHQRKIALSNFVHFKNRPLFVITASCVYKIKCKDRSSIFVVRTSRELKLRLVELRRPSNKTYEPGRIVAFQATFSHCHFME